MIKNLFPFKVYHIPQIMIIDGCLNLECLCTLGKINKGRSRLRRKS